MDKEQKAIQHIINAFTTFQADQVERLYQEDSIFREICQDYAECIQMRDKYASDTTDRDAPQYRQEYEELIEALEEELLAILHGHKKLPQVEAANDALLRMLDYSEKSS